EPDGELARDALDHLLDELVRGPGAVVGARVPDPDVLADERAEVEIEQPSAHLEYLRVHRRPRTVQPVLKTSVAQRESDDPRTLCGRDQRREDSAEIVARHDAPSPVAALDLSR